ncbi:MAG: nuclear transport factor 2 family protein [Dehalococcoidia bacterium]|nr:MAG: nuclear transport factor 2 family protein [Dehalococcoidia bacterium]
MPEHPNVALLRRGYEAFAKGDMATLTELFSEDTVWHEPGNNPLSGEQRGREAVFAMFGRTAQLSGGTYRVELHDVLANDEHAVALSRMTGTRQGKETNSVAVQVYHMRNEKITEAWNFFQDQRAYDEFWS